MYIHACFLMEIEEDTALDIISQLQEENLNLRKQICVLERLIAHGSPSVNGLDDSLSATVIYHDMPPDKRRKVEQFIEALHDDKINESEIELDEDSDEETYQPNTLTLRSGKCADHLNCTCETRPMKLKGAVEYHKYFMFDWLGSPMVVRGDAFTLPDDLRILYEQVYLQPFWVHRTALEMKEESRAKKSSIKCFNCGEDHHMKTCPQPYNPFNVAKSKSVFHDQIGLLPGSDKRYYLELENLERFSKFEPGKISEKLKAALSLQEGDLPIYIIRMRELGYPPGWRLLKEESLKMFDNENEEDVYSKTVSYEDIIYSGFNDKGVINQSVGEDDSLMSSSRDNDLGTLDDYEFDMEDEGGFVLRKLAKDKEDVLEEQQENNEQFKQTRSLDFPPGLVEVDNPQPAKKKWMELFRIIENGRLKKLIQ